MSLPEDIYNRLDRLENKADIIIDKMSMVQERQARLEASQKGFVTAFVTVVTGIIGYLVNIFSK